MASPNAPQTVSQQNPLLQDYTKKLASSSAHSDEMMEPDGSIKPVWLPFCEHLLKLSPQQLQTRFARGDQYLRDAGVLFRQYDETVSSERKWPLSHIPIMLGEDEWLTITSGLIERADLLEFMLRDFYGANELVQKGLLPATLLSQNPSWLRPMVGTAQPDRKLLNYLSFEIARGPDGRWWVISDLIEAPSTAGFAIENRMAMSRVFPNFFGTSNIYRLAAFFQQLQQTLLDLNKRPDGEIVLLSPGLMNQNYAEHAYLARYLGLLLVEGEDLIVQDGKAMVRTVSGAKPISLLWSRLPSAMMDPLELNPESVLGTPGLLRAIREGQLNTVNMVGAGVLETRALMAFLPRIARHVLDRDLALPNIATWWCGQDTQRDHVLQNLSRFMVGNAFSTRPLMADPSTIAISDQSDEEAARNRVSAMLQSEGHSLVGQEAVTLSTTPVYENGSLVPHPMCIRISMGRTENGWTVMPGGYARISPGSDAKALAMQQGGKVADVWITSPTPVSPQTLLSTDRATQKQRPTEAILPSRAADNLFWLGRYIERSEHNMRLFRAYFARISDGADRDDKLPVFIRSSLMNNVGPDVGHIAELFTTPLGLSLQSASRISDRFSPDGMMALRNLVRQTRELDNRSVPLDDITSEVSDLLRQISGFSGLVHENMYRSDGWRFLSIGISLERAANLSALLSACISETTPEGALDLALEVGDSVVSHRTRYLIAASVGAVTDLLGLDTNNPRAIRYHVSRAKDHISALPQSETGHILSDVAGRILSIETMLAVASPGDLTPQFLTSLKQDIWNVSDALTASHLA